ncbi:MAG: AAA family ATPase [Candidatus Bipolaricaulota bacterium]
MMRRAAVSVVPGPEASREILEAPCVAPPSDAPYPYRDYVAARDALLAAIRRGPFYGIVTGASGTGKSSLPREIAPVLDRHRHQVVYLSSSGASVLGTVNHLARLLRVSPRRSSLETALVVAETLKSHAAHFILWIDEAERVAPQTLGELRLLAETDLVAPQLMSVVLSGLPDLRAVLDTPGLFPLKRRISVRCVLEGLRRDELDPFLAHRHGAATARLVPTEVRDDLFERARGTPALIHKVVSEALDRAGADRLGEAHILEALDANGL